MNSQMNSAETGMLVSSCYTCIDVLKELVMKSQGYICPMVEINTLKSKLKLPIYTFYNIRHMGWCHVVITVTHCGKTIYSSGYGEEDKVIKRISNDFVRKFYIMFPDMYDKLHTCSYSIGCVNRMFHVNYSEKDEDTKNFVNLLKRKHPYKSWVRMRVGNDSVWRGCPIYNPYLEMTLSDTDACDDPLYATRVTITITGGSDPNDNVQQPNGNTQMRRLSGRMVLCDPTSEEPKMEEKLDTTLDTTVQPNGNSKTRMYGHMNLRDLKN